jgi:predicted acetyltransferase
MAVEIRSLTQDGLEAAVAMGIRAFAGAGADVGRDIERQLSLYPPEWYLGAYEGEELAAMMRTLPYAMHLNGGTALMGLVSPVASSPLYRRRGHAGAMLRCSLEQMRERGQWLSALYTPHPALYRRYGWEIAADERVYSFKPKDLGLTAGPSQRGRLRALKPGDWQQLAPVYDAYAAQHNGPLVRDEVWWRNWVVETWSGPLEVLLWESDAGVPEGYLLYHEPAWSSPDAGKFMTDELIALNGDAYLNLLTCLSQQDIRDEVVYRASSDDPLPLLFSDAERLSFRQHYTVLLRVVDVAAALSAKPLATPDIDIELTIAVTDRAAPWNEGAWRIRSAGGSTTVEKSGGAGELRLDVGALASLYNGYVSPSQAASTGLISASSEDALRRADRFFAVTHRPYFTDRF